MFIFAATALLSFGSFITLIVFILAHKLRLAEYSAVVFLVLLVVSLLQNYYLSVTDEDSDQ
jgi:uncharacterized membrane protein